MAIASEDCDAIAILVIAGKPHRFFKIIGANDLQNGSENLFLIARHLRCHSVDQCGANEKAFLMALQGKAASINDDFAALLFGSVDPTFDPRFVFGRHDRAVMRIGIV